MNPLAKERACDQTEHDHGQEISVAPHSKIISLTNVEIVERRPRLAPHRVGRSSNHNFHKPHKSILLSGNNTTSVFGAQPESRIPMRSQPHETAAAADEMMEVPLWHGEARGPHVLRYLICTCVQRKGFQAVWMLLSSGYVNSNERIVIPYSERP